jgi:hypothetical protein
MRRRPIAQVLLREASSMVSSRGCCGSQVDRVVIDAAGTVPEATPCVTKINGRSGGAADLSPTRAREAPVEMEPRGGPALLQAHAGADEEHAP